jgi:nucleoid DNA-binding protein
MATKVDLDLRVAQSLPGSKRTPQRVVTMVTTCFLEELKKALVSDGDVYLPGIGRLYVVEYEKANNTNLSTAKVAVGNPAHIRVFFRKAPALRSALKQRKRIWKSTE